MNNNNKKKTDVELKVYFNKTDKDRGYKGYKKQDLRKMWTTMSKNARLYGDNQQANKYEKWSGEVLNEAWKNKEGDKLRRMVKITSNSPQTLRNAYSKDADGMYIKFRTPKTPRDSAKFQLFREARKEAIRTLKVFPTLDIYTQNWIVENGDQFLKDKTPEEVNIVLNIANRVGGYNAAYSKYNADIDRILNGGEISQLEMMLLIGLKGLETKQSDNLTTLRKYNMSKKIVR